jgi:hypothetical protein
VPQNLKFPLLENKNEWHIHGYAYGNYLTELNPPGQVFAKGASLDKAFEGEESCQSGIGPTTTADGTLQAAAPLRA